MAALNSERVERGTSAMAISENDAGATTHSRRAFSIREFCLLYGIGRTNAYQEIAAGRLRAVKVGRRTLITNDAAESWLGGLTELNSHYATQSGSKPIRRRN
jgi:excisionase family DNA binding protein